MSFHTNLIKTIKSDNHESIYLLLDQIIQNPMKDIKKAHIDMFLSFLGTINDHNIILKYYNHMINFYQINNWKHDLSSYPLMIRISCNINDIFNAIEYLKEMYKYKIPIKTPIECTTRKFDATLLEDLPQFPEGFQYDKGCGLDKRQVRRSITPQGFANAFYQANK